MKEFDINKISKQMPYKAPNADFFANFSENLNAKIKARARRRILLWRSVAAAAVVMFALVFEFTMMDKQTQKANSLDNFLVSLSDEDLNALIAEAEYVDDFYANL